MLCRRGSQGVSRAQSGDSCLAYSWHVQVSVVHDEMVFQIYCNRGILILLKSVLRVS